MKNPLIILVFAIAGWLLPVSVVFSQEEEVPTELAGEEPEMVENAVGVGGIVDVVHAEGSKPFLNNNTLGDNDFNNIRTLLNVQFTHGEKLRADVEVLFDDASEDRIRLQGAFVTLFDLPDEKLNLMVGKIPNLFGNFAKREFSNVNPLIGQPLMRQYRTSLDWNNLWNNREQLILKRRRQDFGGDLPIEVLRGAAPTVYDARWDFGVEMFGSLAFFEYQLAVTEGSISNPTAGANDGKQFLGRVGINPAAGLRFGFSGAINPYLSRADDQRLLEAGKGKGEFRQRAYGADVEASYRYLIVFSEFVRSEWDATVEEDQLDNWSWYVDAKYKVHPRFYVAGRYDMMMFGKIRNPDTGAKETWDYNVRRYEAGVGFRVTAEATLKFVAQWMDLDDDSGIKTKRTMAVQLSVPF